MDQVDLDEIEKQFKMIDKDGSGTISKKELTAFIKGTGVTTEVAESEAEKMLQSVDANGDGEIDFNEFRDARLSSKLTDDEMIKTEFKKIDIDGSGTIDSDELAELFNWTLATELISKMIAEIDTDNDGTISLEEFTAAMKKG